MDHSTCFFIKTRVANGLMCVLQYFIKFYYLTSSTGRFLSDVSQPLLSMDGCTEDRILS